MVLPAEPAGQNRHGQQQSPQREGKAAPGNRDDRRLVHLEDYNRNVASGRRQLLAVSGGSCQGLGRTVVDKRGSAISVPLGMEQLDVSFRKKLLETRLLRIVILPRQFDIADRPIPHPATEG